MAAETCKLSYDVLVGMIPFVVDFLDLDSEDIIASGILDDDRLDDAVIAMVLSHEKYRKEKAATSSGSVKPSLSPLLQCLKLNDLSEETKATSQHLESVHQQPILSSLKTIPVDIFRTRFRMNESMFDALMQDLTKLTTFSNRTVEKGALDQVGTSPNPVPPVSMLMFTLQFLGCQQPMSQLAAAANVSETLYSCVVHETMEALYELLQHYIRWPEDSQISEICDKFRQKSGLQGVLGTIDVLHVPVKSPAEHTDYYTNQQNETTVVLQSVCDHRLHFLHCCTGWPGSMDEETVLKDSDLHHDVQDQVNTYFPFDSYLVGDEAYCLTPWLMTPFTDNGNLNTLQQQFNSACHIILQDNTRVYTLLMQRFPRLEFVDMKDMQSMVVTILVCCALHNFCLDTGDQEMCENVQVTVRNINTFSNTDEDNLSEEGDSKRQHVLQLLQEL